MRAENKIGDEAASDDDDNDDDHNDNDNDHGILWMLLLMLLMMMMMMMTVQVVASMRAEDKISDEAARLMMHCFLQVRALRGH
jgi:hypothetical protein